jgi:hypothetical protein
MSPTRTLTTPVSTTATPTATTTRTTASAGTGPATSTTTGDDRIAVPESRDHRCPGMTGSPGYPSVSSCNGSSGPVGAADEREAPT